MMIQKRSSHSREVRMRRVERDREGRADVPSSPWRNGTDVRTIARSSTSNANEPLPGGIFSK